MWKSNPPFDPRRTESPALKAGKVTGPLSPPLLQDHHTTKLIGHMQLATLLYLPPEIPIVGHLGTTNLRVYLRLPKRRRVALGCRNAYLDRGM